MDTSIVDSYISVPMTTMPMGSNHDNKTLELISTTCSPSSNCSANATEPPVANYGRDEDFAKVEIIVQAVILFLAIFGNGVVLLIFVTRRQKLSRMNLMIVHLSIADLFVAFFNILPQLIWDITYRFYGNDFLCRWVKLMQVMAMYASSYVLVSTAIDRYLAICHPLTVQVWTSTKTHVLVAVAWVLSLIFSLPQLVIFGYREVSPGAGVYDCWAVFDPYWTAGLYVTWVTVAIYIVPFILLALAYGRICYVVWRSMMAREPSVRETKRYIWKSGPDRNGGCRADCTKKLTGDRNGTGAPRAHVRTMSKAKVKTVKLTLAVIACYLVCWGPFFISQMWSVWDPLAPFTGKAMTIMLLLAGLNSCTNPWIYLAFSANFYRQLVHCVGVNRGAERGLMSSSRNTRSRRRFATETSRLDTINVDSQV